MRCSLMWKLSAEKGNDSKAKERIVIRGHQQPIANVVKTWEDVGASVGSTESCRIGVSDAKPAFLHDDGQEVQKARPCACENTCAP